MYYKRGCRTKISRATVLFYAHENMKNLYLPISYLCFTKEDLITDNSNQSKDKEMEEAMRCRLIETEF